MYFYILVFVYRSCQASSTVPLFTCANQNIDFLSYWFSSELDCSSIETITPPLFKTLKDLLYVSPPKVSKTASQSCGRSSKDCVLQSITISAPNSGQTAYHLHLPLTVWFIAQRYAKKFFFGSTSHCPANHYLVAFGDGIVMRDLTVWHRLDNCRRNFLYTFWATLHLRSNNGISPYKIRSNNFVCYL